MTRLLLAASFFVLSFSASASAQYDSGTTSLALTAPSETLQAARSQHRVGAALVATGLTANLVGVGATFFSFIEVISSSIEGGSCVPGGCAVSRGNTDWGALLEASITVASVGLVLFFIGLALDIHGHVLRGHAAGSVALTANGLSVSF